VKALAITQGSTMWTLLEEARLWFDLDKGANFGVLGEDCEAIVVISESFEVRKADRFGRKKKGEPFDLK
jgi:hypothetical protein